MEHFQGPLPNGRQGAIDSASGRPSNLHTAQTKANGLPSGQTHSPFQPSGNQRAGLRKGEKFLPQDINFQGKFNKNQTFPQKSVQESCRLQTGNLKMQQPAAEGPNEFRTKLRSSSKNDTTSVPAACQIRSAPLKTTTPRAKPVALTFEPNESKFCKVVQHTQIGAKEALDPTLAAMQRVYSQVLPGMRTETGRILRNWDYTSIVVTGQEVMGGCTFKYHRYESFIELTLLGVAWSCQEFGLGSSIIESLKLHASVKDFSTIVTYADNNAVAFFKKQGFEPLVPTDTTYELVKSTIVACCKSTLMHVTVPLKVQPTVSETFCQLPNNTLLEIKPMSQSSNDCSEDEAIELDISEQIVSLQMQPKGGNGLYHTSPTDYWWDSANAQMMNFDHPSLSACVPKMSEYSAEDTQSQNVQKSEESYLKLEEQQKQKKIGLGLIFQITESQNQLSWLQRQHSVNFSRKKPCRTAMKEPLRSPTAMDQKDTDHSDRYEVDSSIGSPFRYQHQSKEEFHYLQDADEVYPNDLDMSSESSDPERSPLFKVSLNQSVLSASELEPMFPCQDVRTKVLFNEPNFAKYQSIITKDKTTNLRNSFILTADVDQLNQLKDLSKEDVTAQYLKSLTNVVLPRAEAFKDDFISNSCSRNFSNEEIDIETPIRRKAIEDSEFVPVAVQKQRKEFFAQLSEYVTVDASDNLRRSEQFCSLYQKNEVSGKVEVRNRELKFLSKEKNFDFNALDQILLGEDQDDHQKVSKNLSTMPQEISVNKSFKADHLSLKRDSNAVKKTQHTETPTNQLIKDFNRQNSKNTFNSTDTTCMGTTPENSEVCVAPAVKDCKLDFKDIKVFKTIVFDIFIQHENKVKELERPSLADCFLVGWSKKALISADANTERKIAEWITMCQIQPTLCSCIGSATSQPDLEPSFDLWRKRDAKALSKL